MRAYVSIAQQTVQVTSSVIAKIRLKLEEKKQKKEKENRKGAKVKSWSPKAPAANCSHCNLISTSRRIDIGSAISNRQFDMPKPRESCMWVLKNG